MSTVFSVKEYFEAKNLNAISTGIIADIINRIYFIANKTEDNSNYINSISVNDTEIWKNDSFDNPRKLSSIIEKIDIYNCKKIVVSYNSYEYSTDDVQVSKLLDMSIKRILHIPQEQLNKLFYCVYYDCDQRNDDFNIGYVNAFGSKNNIVYNGPISFTRVDNIPEKGCWITPNYTACYHGPVIDGLKERVAEICNEYKDIIKEMEFTISNDNDPELSLDICCDELANSESVKNYVKMANKLMLISDNILFESCEFIDVSSEIIRIMRFEFNEPGNISMSLIEF